MSTAISKTDEIIEYVPNTDMMQLRVENEMMMAECRARPRSIALMKDELAEMLEAFPAMADGAIYSKPCGKDDDGKPKYAEGLSIRCAELLAEVYGFNRVECVTSDIDSDKVKIEATFTDYQKGRVWKDTGVLSKLYKDRYGKVARTPDDRFYGVVCKAEASRRIREVILRSVNSALKAWFEAKCRELMDQTLDDAGIKLIVANFAKIGVSEKMIEGVLGRPRDMGWTQEDRRVLSGIWNALKQNETTIAEAFPAPEQTPTNGNGNHATKSDAIAEKLKQKSEESKEPEKPTEKKKEPEPQSQLRECVKFLKDKGVECIDANPEETVLKYKLADDSVLTICDGAKASTAPGLHAVDTLDSDAITQVINIYDASVKKKK